MRAFSLPFFLDVDKFREFRKLKILLIFRFFFFPFFVEILGSWSALDCDVLFSAVLN